MCMTARITCARGYKDQHVRHSHHQWGSHKTWTLLGSLMHFVLIQSWAHSRSVSYDGGLYSTVHYSTTHDSTVQCSTWVGTSSMGVFFLMMLPMPMHTTASLKPGMRSPRCNQGMRQGQGEDSNRPVCL